MYVVYVGLIDNFPLTSFVASHVTQFRFVRCLLRETL